MRLSQAKSYGEILCALIKGRLLKGGWAEINGSIVGKAKRLLRHTDEVAGQAAVFIDIVKSGNRVLPGG